VCVCVRVCAAVMSKKLVDPIKEMVDPSVKVPSLCLPQYMPLFSCLEYTYI
jgi:hypothetical protein